MDFLLERRVLLSFYFARNNRTVFKDTKWRTWVSLQVCKRVEPIAIAVREDPRGRYSLGRRSTVELEPPFAEAREIPMYSEWGISYFKRKWNNKGQSERACLRIGEENPWHKRISAQVLFKFCFLQGYFVRMKPFVSLLEPVKYNFTFIFNQVSLFENYIFPFLISGEMSPVLNNKYLCIWIFHWGKRNERCCKNWPKSTEILLNGKRERN